jgi:hypothetical protein
MKTAAILDVVARRYYIYRCELLLPRGDRAALIWLQYTPLLPLIDTVHSDCQQHPLAAPLGLPRCSLVIRYRRGGSVGWATGGLRRRQCAALMSS